MDLLLKLSSEKHKMVVQAQKMISFVGRFGSSRSHRVIQASVERFASEKSILVCKLQCTSRGVSLCSGTLNLPLAKNFVSSSIKCEDASSMMDKSGKLPR